jgi:glutathione peroxidase
MNALNPLNNVHALDLHITDLGGSPVDTAALRGRVLLVVNTASACGLTPQFAGLEALWTRYRDQGLTVVGFPCNQFGAQDPGTHEEIATFCQSRYGVSFPMMAKVEVNGPNADPLWQWLRAQAPGSAPDGAIAWNFTKFLIGRDGRVVERFEPTTTPESMASAIEQALAA